MCIDRVRGVDVSPSAGIVTIHAGSRNRIYVNSFEPFQGDFKLEAIYENGVDIPWDGTRQAIPSQTVVIDGGGLIEGPERRGLPDWWDEK